MLITHNPTKSAFNLQQGNDCPTEMSCGDIRFHGTALLLKSDAAGRAYRAFMGDGKYLAIKGKHLFTTDTPTPARSLNIR
ncbi:MAG: hypothetical protein KAJ52_10040 [Sedimentisphaerales bacterium]|nr:hypothetical protein [Sedimentisphaerales bacterium]